MHCTALHRGTVRIVATENYSLRLDPERRRKLASIAEKQDRDVAYIIRKAIDEYLERHQDETTATDRDKEPWPPRTPVVRLDSRPGHARQSPRTGKGGMQCPRS